MTNNPHIVKSFDDDLQRLEALFLEMAGRVENQISEACQTIIRYDSELVERVIESDRIVDSLELQLNDMAVRILAQRQPMAGDLRAILVLFKIASNLERIGDLAKNIAKRSGILAEFAMTRTTHDSLKRIGDLVLEMMGGVVEAYLKRDSEAASNWRMKDIDIDHLHNSLHREYLTYMMEMPANITPCMHMLFIAKNFERMGDHVTNIAEQVNYMVEGSLPDEERLKGDETVESSVQG